FNADGSGGRLREAGSNSSRSTNASQVYVDLPPTARRSCPRPAPRLRLGGHTIPHRRGLRRAHPTADPGCGQTNRHRHKGYGFRLPHCCH
ncbi:unnamed protein product, partial [Ectocarpus sp. 12 AP-2014]